MVQRRIRNRTFLPRIIYDPTKPNFAYTHSFHTSLGFVLAFSLTVILAQSPRCYNNMCQVQRNHTIEIFNMTEDMFNATEFEQTLRAIANLKGVRIVETLVRKADLGCDELDTTIKFDARTDPITGSQCSPSQRRRDAKIPPSTAAKTVTNAMSGDGDGSGSSCFNGTYVSKNNTTCKNCTVCEDGKYEMAPCTPTAD
eukprot:gene11177-3235_t